MKLKIKAGTTSRIVRLVVKDSSSSTGGNLTGLVYNSGSLTAYYSRVGDSSATAITLVTATVGTFTSSGFKEVDSTNMPGVYELGVPNAALASGSTAVHIMLKGATNMVPVAMEIELDAVDYQDSNAFGLAELGDIYTAKIDLTLNSGSATDEYTVVWFKNGTRITAGITNAKIQIIKRVDGTDLVALTAMTQIASTASYKYDETSNRITPGIPYLALVTATIDSGSREWATVVTRDV